MAAPLRVRVRHTPRAGAAAAGGGVGVACRVCGRAGHAAGFIGAVYYDCPNLACYLCKGAGHTTASCPHRAYETAVPTVAAAGGPPTAAAAGGPPPPQPSRLQALAARAAGALRGPAALAALRASCGAARVLAAHAAAAAGSACGCGARACASLAAPWRVGAAAHRLHARRVSVLAWHPDPAMAGLLASGDKSGELGVWRVLGDGGGGGMARRSVYAGHAYLINALEWAAGNGAVSSLRAFTASSDGTLRLQHVERQASDDLATANAGWAGGPETAWRMFYSLARGRSGGGEDDPLLWAGDDAGRLWCVDVRAGGAVARVQAHRAKSKILSLSVHPTDPHTLASAGGDWSVKLWDLRALRPAPGAARLGDAAPAPAAQPLVTLPHGRAVSAAAFSPQTGSRLLTTCGDNRLRIWDDTGALLAAATDPAIDARRLEPDITIVHSHDFARYLAPARAVWDAKDASEATLLCGRYISRPCDLGTLRADVGAPVSSCGRLAARAEPAAGSDHVVALHPIDVYEAPAGRGCNALCVVAASQQPPAAAYAYGPLCTWAPIRKASRAPCRAPPPPLLPSTVRAPRFPTAPRWACMHAWASVVWRRSNKHPCTAASYRTWARQASHLPEATTRRCSTRRACRHRR